MKLGYSSCEWALLKGFSRSEVKGQGHDQPKYCIGGGMHIDGVALRLTCLFTRTFSTFHSLDMICQQSWRYELSVCKFDTHIFDQTKSNTGE